MKYELINDTMLIRISSIAFKTVGEFLDYYVPSKKIRYLLFQNQWIKIDKKKVSRNENLVGNNLRIKIYPTYFGNRGYFYSKGEIDLVYEDEFIIVVNKRSGIIVHDDGNSAISLQDMVNDYYSHNGVGIKVQALHRLDRETTGLVIFSKTPIFQPLFDKMISEKKIKRRYLAIVKGYVPKNTKMEFVDCIGKNRHDSSKRIAKGTGKEAKTRAISLGNYFDFSLIKCFLDTGRTHQIRIHLSLHGMPIVNDKLYGVSSDIIKEMGLFGYELLFDHPITGETIHLLANFDKKVNTLIERFC